MSIHLLFASLTLVTLAAPAAGQGPGRLPAGGSEVFRFALHTQHTSIEPVTEVSVALADPRGTIIIVIGDTKLLHLAIPSVRLYDFVLAGGSVLIATDHTNVHPRHVLGGDPGWGTVFGGIEISGRQLQAGRGPNYGETRGRPYVQPRQFDIRQRNIAPYHLFDGFAQFGDRAVATDRPSDMRVPQVGGGPALARFRAHNLAGYPNGVTGLWDNGRVLAGRDNFAFALTPQFGPGRFLVLADGQVFANGMLGFVPDNTQELGYRFDNANWEFANRTITWLQQDGPKGALRTRCLFIEEGRIVEKFAEKRPIPPRPPIPDIPPDVLANILLNHSNAVIDDLQEKNFFNRVVEGFLGFPRIVRLFLIVVTVLFLYFALRWLARGYRKAEPAVVSPAVQAALLPRGGVLRQRTAAQIEVGNLYEAAARRVRDRFDVLGGRPGTDGQMPPVLLAVDLRDGPLITQTVRWLWSVGYGESPVAVPPIEWDRLNNLLERVTARAARGDWSFGADV